MLSTGPEIQALLEKSLGALKTIFGLLRNLVCSRTIRKANYMAFSHGTPPPGFEPGNP
ncbi:MAG: hypothetical protein KKD18_04970 [Nanoarchaeota archaeon]|nr:hypothetical protein [Nanoarchaeota archaeon]MBU0977743.1 hypothetical protein [Nanoarchaeota archaeon]